ncbi:MAG: ferredoxin [Oscillospiraceae bacterium]
MKVKVDKNGCIGCALCVETCPQVFELDEDGLSQVIGNKISDDDMERVKIARDECPVSVITVL